MTRFASRKALLQNAQDLLNLARFQDWVHLLGIPLLGIAASREWDARSAVIALFGSLCFFVFGFAINRCADLLDGRKGALFRSAQRISLIAVSFALLSSFFLPRLAFLILLLACALAFLYSYPPFVLKRHPIVGTLMNGAGFSLLAVFGYVSSGRPLDAFGVVFGAFIGFLTLIGQVADEWEDREEDGKLGFSSTAAILPGKAVQYGIAALFLLTTPFALLLEHMQDLPPAFLLSSVVFSGYGAWYAIASFRTRPPGTFRRVLRFLGIGYGTAMLAVFLAAGSSDIDRAIRKGAGFLQSAQMITGEFATLACGRESAELCDTISSPFTTAHILYSLHGVQESDPRMTAKALDFLERERREGMWTFWSTRSSQHDALPPDADDTALASLVLGLYGREMENNRSVFQANRTPSGLYNTWFFDSGTPFTLGVPQDVDCVVNANVLLYLRQEDEAVCSSLVRAARERDVSCLVHYPDRFSLLSSMARGFRRGIPCMAEARDSIIRDVLGEQRPDGSWGSAMRTALAATILLDYQYEGEGLDRGHRRPSAFPTSRRLLAPLPLVHCSGTHIRIRRAYHRARPGGT